MIDAARSAPRPTGRGAGRDREGTGSMWCEIRVASQLDARWSAWLAGLAIATTDGGESVLTGAGAAERALHGRLGRRRDLNLPLRLVVCREDDGPRPDPRAVRPTRGERSDSGQRARGAGEAPGPPGRPGGGPAGAAASRD